MKTLAAAMLLLPICASAESPWQYTAIFGKTPYQTADCTDLKLVGVFKDGSQGPYHPFVPWHLRVPDAWDGKWKRCRVRHEKTGCIAWFARAVVFQRAIDGFSDERTLYRMRLGDWHCPTEAAPPPEDEARFFQDTAVIISASFGKPIPEDPSAVPPPVQGAPVHLAVRIEAPRERNNHEDLPETPLPVTNPTRKETAK